MNFQLDIAIPFLEPRILHQAKILLIGSCFTEHICNFLNKAKFNTVQNSHGIVFNPLSVCKALHDVIDAKIYKEEELFFLNEYWHGWYHHSYFSDMNKEVALTKMNASIQSQHHFLKEANYVFITLGSAFAYKHVENNIFVSNNHRAPAQWFEKELLEISVIKDALQEIQTRLKKFNPSLQLVFTVSPVRHIRDGVIENNRSKARLIEAVHALEQIYYFPAYELVIDILRDYRFYDIDMVHPNYQATSYVWEKFIEYCIDPSCFQIMKKMEQIYKAKNHISKNKLSEAHKKFLNEHLELCQTLKQENAYLNLEEEMEYFTAQLSN
jgi:hypothetical protein